MNKTKIIQVWNLLRYTFGIAVIVAGLDKLMASHLITYWEQYVSPTALQWLMMDASMICWIAGFAEVIVGALIIFQTRIGAMIASGWMVVVILNLLSMGMYYDIIVRDALITVALVALIILTDALDK